MFNVRVELRGVPAKSKRTVYTKLRKSMIGNGFNTFTPDRCSTLQDAEYGCDVDGRTLDQALDRAVAAAGASGYDFSVRAIKMADMKTHNLKPARPEAVRKEAAIRRPSRARRKSKC